MLWNGCSPSAGICVHDAPEYAPKLAELFDELTESFDWPESNIVAGRHVVPFGRWTRVASVFIRGGYSALVELAVPSGAPSDDFPFCLSFLEKYKTPESVEAIVTIIEILQAKRSRTAEARRKTTESINLLLSFKDSPAPSNGQESTVRSFLHDNLREATTTSDRAVIMCALRGVGNEQSLKLVGNAGPLDSPWEDVPATVKRTIRRRLRNTELC